MELRRTCVRAAIFALALAFSPVAVAQKFIAVQEIPRMSEESPEKICGASLSQVGPAACATPADVRSTSASPTRIAVPRPHAALPPVARIIAAVYARP